jgi:hypothetical protein
VAKQSFEDSVPFPSSTWERGRNSGEENLSRTRDFVIADFGRAAGIRIPMRFFLALLAISAALGSAKANLGDSEAKINTAYGKRIEMPRIAGNQGHLYERGEFIYNVIFRDGVSVFEMYARANQAELSSKEIAAFLKANAAGATWIPANEKPAGREWKRSDHKAKAAYFRLGGRPTLTVMEATRK